MEAPPRVGYACIALAVPGTALSTCSLRDAAADPGRLRAVAAANLRAVEAMVEDNARTGIRMYRLSSDLIPLATHPTRPIDLEDALGSAFAPDLARIGERIRATGQRVSMHPGQYTVLNSPDPDVVARSADDLAYHAAVLDALGTGAEARIILHVGGGYGDRDAAKERFVRRFRDLPGNVRSRIAVENDDRIFTPCDVRDVAAALSIPAVYDNLHAALNPCGGTDAEWTARFAATWKPEDGAPKIHYSQQAPDRRNGSHSDSLRTDRFVDHLRALRGPSGGADGEGRPAVRTLPDAMLEVKDKNVSARRAALAADQLLRPDARSAVRRLEAEWARWKYRVLARSERDYDAVRQLLKDKAPTDPLDLVLRFCRLVEDAAARPEDPGAEVNAAEHVWGYFKAVAEPSERRRFDAALADYRAGRATASRLRAHLHRLAERHAEPYLLESYYFLD